MPLEEVEHERPREYEELVASGKLEENLSDPVPTVDLVLTAPAVVGDRSWTIVIPEQEIAGVPHEAVGPTVTTTVVPHVTSAAVWDVPSPLRGGPFTVRVGIKCSAGCSLAGQQVEILDDSGRRLAVARLGDAPRPGTTALYEAEVSLVAPGEVGVFARSVTFAPAGLGLPHEGARADFTFRSLAPPEHTVTVALVPQGVEAPLGGIEVFLGPYSAETDARGVATVAVPRGTYEVSAWRVDLESVSARLEVTGDATVELDVEPRRPLDDDAERDWA